MLIQQFVGLPWRERGRDELGADCWGLGVVLYRELLGVDLPDRAEGYASIHDRTAVAGVIAAGLGDWIKVDPGQERPLDGVLIRERPWHIGWVQRPGWMLHMPEGASAQIVSYRSPMVAPRVVGFYRHRSQEAVPA